MELIEFIIDFCLSTLQIITSIMRHLPDIKRQGLKFQLFQEDSNALQKYGNNKAAQYAAKITGCGDLFQVLSYQFENQLSIPCLEESLILNSKYIFKNHVYLKLISSVPVYIYVKKP